jgi:hypothetical protein
MPNAMMPPSTTHCHCLHIKSRISIVVSFMQRNGGFISMDFLKSSKNVLCGQNDNSMRSRS